MWPSVTMASSTLIISIMAIVSVTESTGAFVAPNLTPLSVENLLTQIATNQLAILSLINEVQSPKQESESNHSAMVEQLKEIRENLEEIRSNEMEKDLTINNTLTTLQEKVARLSSLYEVKESERNHSAMLEQLQEVRENLEEMRSNEMEKDLTINNTLTTLQEEVTRHSSLHEEKGCESGGAVYHHGQIKAHPCYPIQCVNGNMSPVINHTTGNSCVAPFEPFLDSCYYLIKIYATWCEGRQHCQRLGGDLPMEPDLTTINAFITLKDRSWAWVGLRDTIWLTGQKPREEDWATNEPTADDGCGYVYKSKVKDYGCTETSYTICQLY